MLSSLGLGFCNLDCVNPRLDWAQGAESFTSVKNFEDSMLLAERSSYSHNQNNRIHVTLTLH